MLQSMELPRTGHDLSTENKNKFLDDMTVEELSEKLNMKIILTNGDGGQVLKDILGVE